MSDDLITLLKAHDPEPVDSWSPAIEPLLARLEVEPPPSPRRSSRAPSRRTLGAALTAAATAAVVAGLAVGIGGERTDVVAAARAAVAGDDVIVHTVTRTIFQNPNGSRVSATQVDGRRRIGIIGRTERWAAGSPERWRMVVHVRPARGMPGGTGTSAYADGVLRSRTSWEKGVNVHRIGPRPTEPASVALLTGTDDPLAAVRAMLESGEAREAGETTRDGRRVLRLVSERPAGRTKLGRSPQERAVYLVDAQTYAPIEVESQLFLRTRDGRLQAGPRTRVVFDRYERLPLSTANERLLRLDG